MANNKVIYGDTTIMDITDTTAEASDVASGEVFYSRDGVRRVGTGNYMDKVTSPTADDVLITDATGQAVDSGVSINDLATEAYVDDKFMVINWSTTDYATIRELAESRVPFWVIDPTLPISDPTMKAFHATQVTVQTTSVSFKCLAAYTHYGYTVTAAEKNRAVGETYASNTYATDSAYGLVKTNSAKSITLNADGQLEVGGRIGQFPGTTGLYAPDDREPRNVGNYCLMITDVKGAQMTNSRSFAVVSGANISLKTAATAGATEYHVSNTYVNRIRCKVLEGGFAAKDEATSGAEQVIPVVSVTIGGEPYRVSSAPDDPTQDIVITTESTLNPDSEITSIRAVGTMGSYSTAHVGNGIASLGGGRCLLLGSTITKDGPGNECGVVASDTYVYGNGSAVFGRYHILNKNRAFLAGVGHDTTYGRTEGLAAVGVYSLLDEKTVFAVGLGASQISRKNAFEVTADHGGTAKANFVDAKNGKIEFASEEDIIPAIAAGNWTIGTGGSIQNFDGTPGFATTDVKGTTVNITVAAGYAMPVTPGETVTWSFKARKRTGNETGKLQLNLLKCNAVGGGTSSNLVKDGTAASYSTEWTTYSGTFTIPSGMEFILPRMTRTNTGAGSSGGYDIKDLTVTKQVDSGIVLTAPNGTKWKVTVDNNGNLGTTAV